MAQQPFAIRTQLDFIAKCRSTSPLHIIFRIYFHRFLLLFTVAKCVDTLITLMALPIYIYTFRRIRMETSLEYESMALHTTKTTNHLIDTVEKKMAISWR